MHEFVEDSALSFAVSSAQDVYIGTQGPNNVLPAAPKAGDVYFFYVFGVFHNRFCCRIVGQWLFFV